MYEVGSKVQKGVNKEIFLEKDNACSKLCFMHILYGVVAAWIQHLGT